MKTNPDSAIPLLQQAAQKSIEGDYFRAAASALRNIGVKYNELGNFKDAMDYYNKALLYALKANKKSEIALCHNDFAVVYDMQGDYVKAAEEFFKALDVLKTLDYNNREGNFYPEITVYANLGDIYHKLNQDDKALEYFRQAESIARSVKIDSGERNRQLARIYSDKANFFREIQKPDSAVKYCYETLDITSKFDAKMVLHQLHYQLLANAILGEVFLDKGEYEKAISYSREVIPLAKNKYAYIAYGASSVISDALYHLKRYKEAEAVSLAALKDQGILDKRYGIEFYSILIKGVQGYTTI